MKKIAFVLMVGLLLLASCASVDTVKPFIADPSFQEENMPIRELRVAVYSDHFYERKEIEEAISEVSQLLKEQVGIALKIVSFLPIEWEERERVAMLKQIASKSCDTRKEFDIALGFTGFTFGDMLKSLIVNWRAITDDTFRRYIVTKELSVHVLAHEISHCFIFVHSHGAGLMQGVSFSLLPLTPPINESDFLSLEDRKEVLQNKWRNFNEAPVLRPEDVEDEIGIVCNE